MPPRRNNESDNVVLIQDMSTKLDALNIQFQALRTELIDVKTMLTTKVEEMDALKVENSNLKLRLAKLENLMDDEDAYVRS